MAKRLSLPQKTDHAGFSEKMKEIAETSPFSKIHRLWFQCFCFTLSNMEVGYKNKTMASLFYDYDVNSCCGHNDPVCEEPTSEKARRIQNRKAKESAVLEFKEACKTKSEEILSYTKLFELHKKFRKAFDEELEPLVTKECCVSTCCESNTNDACCDDACCDDACCDDAKECCD